MDLFETGWRRSGFGSSDDELQFRDRAREAMRLYWERERDSEGEPVWLERKFDIRIGEHHVRGRVDRVDRLPGGGYELIDYKTGERKSEADLESDLQLALYRLAAREAWDLEAKTGSYYYVLDAEKVAAPVRARRRRAGRAHRLPGGRGRPRPGLRAPPLADRLQLVRLPADLPGGGELSGAGWSDLRYRVPMAPIRQSGGTAKDAAAAAEEVRVKRLREDAQRPMSVNLAETIALSHRLLLIADAAQR